VHTQICFITMNSGKKLKQIHNFVSNEINRFQDCNLMVYHFA
jgi:hypothetical protein